MLTAILFRDTWIYFSFQGAKLPILKRDGSIEMIQWGMRLKDHNFDLPLGRWISLEDIRAGAFKNHQRRPVKVPASKYWMTREDRLKEFDVPPGKFLQAVVMRINPDDDKELVAYLVNTEATPDMIAISERWPRLV